MEQKKPIKWEEVIELNGAIAPALRTQLSQALHKIEKSKVGQELFKEMLELRNLQGLGPFTPATLMAHANKYYPVGPLRSQLQGIYRDRKDPEKLVIYAEDSPNIETASPLTKQFKKTSGSFAYDEIVDVAYLEASSFSKMLLPLIKNGEKVMGTLSLDEGIIHELRHVVDARKAIRDKRQLSLQCREERGVDTENAYRVEKGDATKRYAYINLDYDLKQLLAANPDIKSFLTNSNNADMNVLKNKLTAFRLVAKGVILNSGCGMLSQEAMIDETKKVLKDNGVSLDGIAIPPQLIPRPDQPLQIR